MTKQELLQRTKNFALRVVRAVQALPREDVAHTLGRQLLRSGTSVGANYRAAWSLYWMELLVDSGLMSLRRLLALMREGNELLAITVSAIKTTRSLRSS